MQVDLENALEKLRSAKREAAAAAKQLDKAVRADEAKLGEYTGGLAVIDYGALGGCPVGDLEGGCFLGMGGGAARQAGGVEGSYQPQH